jgi:hypothetical protein
MERKLRKFALIRVICVQNKKNMNMQKQMNVSTERRRRSMLVTLGEAKQPEVYASPTVSIRRVELEGWIATTPEVSNTISDNLVGWGTEDIRLGDTSATEGGDVYFFW